MASAGAKTDSFMHCNTWNSARIHITNQTKHESKAVDMQMRYYVQHTSKQPEQKGSCEFTDACKTVCCPYNKSATYEPESKHTVERDWGTAET